MQLLRFPALALPAHIVQLVRLVGLSQAALEANELGSLVRERGIGAERYREGNWSANVMHTWERHNEASTVTVTMTGDAATDIHWRGVVSSAFVLGIAAPAAVLVVWFELLAMRR